jgi:transcriptional regulator with XRE-family HTH domain
MPTEHDLRERVHDLCTQRKISQADLARRLGVTRQSLQLTLRPENRPRIDTLQRIADALDVGLAELVGGGAQ